MSGEGIVPLPRAGTAIASLAILKVNSDDGHDYIDGFVPFAAECLRQSPNPNASLEELDSCFRAEFGFDVPLPALKTILGRAAHEGLLEIEAGTYVRTEAIGNDSNFRGLRGEALRQLRAVVDGLQAFAKNQHALTWSLDEAQTYLFAHIQEHAVPLLSAAVDGTPITASPLPDSPLADHIVSEFILHAAEAKPDTFRYLETLVKGAMLASVLFFPDLGQVGRRFDRLVAFIDTPVLLRAIGAHGATAERSAKQVIDLAYGLGIEPKCFRSTFDETFGVLNAAARELRRYGAFTMETSETIEYLLEEGYEASDVELLIAKLEGVLESIHIQVVDRPPPDPDLTVDEAALGEAINEEVQYRRPEALKHDVDAATAVHRLRRGRLCRTLEDARAIFVSTNTSLARGARRFFREVYGGSGVPIIAVAHHFGTLLWLKKPTAAPDLPRDLLIASCYAALNPPDALWQRYLTEIEKLRVRGNISAEDYHLLRFDLSSKSSLLTLTGGRQDAFVDGTVQEVLRRARANARRDAEEAMAASQEEASSARAAAKATSTRARAERLGRQARYRTIGRLVGSAVRYGLQGIAFLVTLILALATAGVLADWLRLSMVLLGAVVSGGSAFGWSPMRWFRLKSLKADAAVSRAVTARVEFWMESEETAAREAEAGSDDDHGDDPTAFRSQP